MEYLEGKRQDRERDIWMDEYYQMSDTQECDLLSVLRKCGEEEIDLLVEELGKSHRFLLKPPSWDPLKIKARIQRLSRGSLLAFILSSEIAYPDIVRKVAKHVGAAPEPTDSVKRMEEAIHGCILSQGPEGPHSVHKEKINDLIRRYGDLIESRMANMPSGLAVSLAKALVVSKKMGIALPHRFYVENEALEELVSETYFNGFSPLSFRFWISALLPEYRVLIPVIAYIGVLRVTQDAFQTQEDLRKAYYEQ